MFKVVCLLKKKPELSREEFISYYNNNHVHLALEVFPQIKGHRRNFLEPEGAFLPPGMAPPAFDCITEMFFADRAGFDAMLVKWGDPAVADRLARDEENFLDRPNCGMFIVQENSNTSTD